ncbi:hypothetical protein Syun_014031 [Stephania yunnanensis]|uniref:Transmembrane protein n=1 Tax=Stephania yunnanensis TaxID=152371 RepID=A0AAP0JJM8_9MAGN
MELATWRWERTPSLNPMPTLKWFLFPLLPLVHFVVLTLFALLKLLLAVCPLRPPPFCPSGSPHRHPFLSRNPNPAHRPSLSALPFTVCPETLTLPSTLTSRLLSPLVVPGVLASSLSVSSSASLASLCPVGSRSAVVRPALSVLYSAVP